MRRVNLILALGFAAALVGSAAPAEPAPRDLEARLLTPHLIEVEPARRLNINCVGAGSPYGTTISVSDARCRTDRSLPPSA